jgi:branched-subunit amino acid ABC-type transport system permease component
MTTDTKPTPETISKQAQRAEWLKQNRTRLSVIAVLVFLLLAALAGLEPDDRFATIMQGLSVGAITFLVASGLSLIFGLMDVLNLAHGEIFMLGAYVGWTIYTRFDTAVDVAVPLLLVTAPFALMPLWHRLANRIRRLDINWHAGLWVVALAVAYISWLLLFARSRADAPDSGASGFVLTIVTLLFVAALALVVWRWRHHRSTTEGVAAAMKLTAWSLFIVGLGATVTAVTKFPLVIWNAEDFAKSPTNFSVQIDLGTLAPLPPDTFSWPALLAFAVLLVGGALIALGLSCFRTHSGELADVTARHWAAFAGMVIAALLLHLTKASINEWVFGLSTTWRFFLAMIVATGVGAAVGAFIEVVLIRPLYDRPLYQLMITLGVGFILIELVREIWGRPEFTMARPAAFNGTGEGCPGEGLGGFFSGCSTVDVFGSRLRVYNEGFIVLVGLLVLIGVTLLLKRTRIGMVIRAGVQDPEMVESLGINVRRVFTLVFAMGSALAALGGVLAAPSIGLSTGMGAIFLLGAIVALAIGGLTSFPGAAAGAVLVGLLQQLIIRFGQTGISLPFLDEPFKPSPTVVPAAAIMLMVVVLLVLPSGLFGRSER